MLDQEEEVNGERFVLLDAYAALAEYRSGQSTLVNDAVAAGWRRPSPTARASWPRWRM